MSILSRLVKNVDVPVRNAPFDIIKRIQTDFTEGKLARGSKVNFDTYGNTIEMDKLPTELRAVLRDSSIRIPESGKIDDATILVNGKDSGVKIGESRDYLFGDAFEGRPPRIKEFYAKLGVSTNVMDTNPVVKESLKQLDSNFKELKGYADGYQARLAKSYSDQYRAKYTEDPAGFKKYCDDYPDEFVKYLEELEKTPAYKARMFADEKAKALWDSIKKNKYKSLILALIAIVSPIVWSITEEYRQEQNGCRLYDNEGGLLDKVELLTCSDSAVKAVKDKSASDTKVPLRMTCATQNYPGSIVTACPSDQFNPCLSIAKNRGESDNYPMVPDVCDTYLYRKRLGDKDVGSGITRIDSCGNVTEDGFCSAEYCDAARFGDALGGKSLKCVNMSWSEAFFKKALSFAQDVICLALPFCSPSSSAGVWNLEWIKWVFFGVVVLAALVFAYRKFRANSQNSQNSQNVLGAPNRAELERQLRALRRLS